MSVFSNNLLLGAGGQSTGPAPFDPTVIGNSVWLDGSADYLSRTNFTLSSDGVKEFIFSMWIQRNKFGVAQTHFDLVPTGHSSYNDGVHFMFPADDQLAFSVGNGGSSGGEKITTAAYRDVSWYHVLISYNTNTSVAAPSRHRLFVNGLEISDTSAYTAPPDNQSCIGSGTGNADLRIGRTDHSGIPYPPNAYFAQACYLEGKSFQAGDYSITDFLDTFTFGTNGSQFVPKADADIAALASTAGGNSFCLDFANSSDLGNDISSNNNDLTPTSMAAANQSTNTPSLTFPLLNPLSAAFSTTLSNGNTTASGSTGNGDDINPGIIIPKTGKWVWQITNTTDADLIYGVRNFKDMKAGDYSYTNLYGFYSHTGNLVQGASPSGSYLDAASGGDVYQIYYNAETRKMWVSDNGTIPNSGDPDAGSNEAFTIPDSGFDLCPTALVGGTAPNSTFDFGLSGVTLHANGQDFKPLTSANLSAPDYQGIDYFSPTLYEGNGEGQRVGDFVPFTDSYTINNSAMFNEADERSFRRTPSSAGNQKTWTFSTWMKRTQANADYSLLNITNSKEVQILLHNSPTGSIEVFFYNGSATDADIVTAGGFEDMSNWHNIVVAVDTRSNGNGGPASANDRIIIYVDGVRQTLSTSDNPSDDYDTLLNTATEHTIGQKPNGADDLQGYLADTVLIDGSQLTASSFGQVDTSTNRWGA
jgi:hypothetical protein